MTCILIDDERISLQALAAKIKMVAPEIHITAHYQSPNDALKNIEKERPDIVFLDIDMPEMDGFTFLKNNPYKDAFVIFTTAHAKYAIAAIRAEAVDFLTKPIDINELADAIKRVKLKIETAKNTQHTPPLSIPAPFINIAQKIPIASAKGVQFVPIADIIWLKSEGNYTIFYLSNTKTIIATKNLKDFEELLSPLGFLRVHHSAIVNTAHILTYTRGEGGTLTLTNNQEIDVSKRKKAEVLAYLGL